MTTISISLHVPKDHPERDDITEAMIRTALANVVSVRKQRNGTKRVIGQVRHNLRLDMILDSWPTDDVRVISLWKKSIPHKVVKVQPSRMGALMGVEGASMQAIEKATGVSCFAEWDRSVVVVRSWDTKALREAAAIVKAIGNPEGATL